MLNKCVSIKARHDVQRQVLYGWETEYSAVPLKRGQFSKDHKQTTPHSSPVRASYGVSFVETESDRYSTSIPATINAISYNIGPRYNGTRL